jgi:hypothetical protein
MTRPHPICMNRAMLPRVTFWESSYSTTRSRKSHSTCMSKKGRCCGPVHVKPFAFECHRIADASRCLCPRCHHAGGPVLLRVCAVCVKMGVASPQHRVRPGHVTWRHVVVRVQSAWRRWVHCDLHSALPLLVRPVCSPPPSPSLNSFVLHLLSSLVPCDCRASTLLACTTQSAPCTLGRFVLCEFVALPSSAPPPPATFSLTKN